MNSSSVSSATGPDVAVSRPRLMRAAARFGVTAFRPGQEQLIDAVLRGEDAVGVLPTGGGKSLCYQLPSMFLPQLTVVVSPLIALMQDQEAHCDEADLESSTLNSALSSSEKRHNEHEVRSGESSLLYVTPERLETDECVALLRTRGVSRLVIDEAHCVSDWGHDFRPAFLRIREAARRLGSPPILALTATATEETTRDIVAQLGMRTPRVVRPGLARNNLTFEVRRTVNEDVKRAALEEILATVDGTIIVYVATVTLCDEIWSWLSESRADVGRYHGERPMRERRETQRRFMGDELRVMVATKAFGLGIDKPDIRAVVHWTFPDSIETYYQEAGRAGRDRKPARAVLFYRLEDRRIQSYFLGTKYPRPAECTKLCTLLPQLESPVSLDALADLSEIPERRLRVILAHLERARVVDRTGDVVRVRATDAGAAELGEIVKRYTQRRLRDRERLAAMMRYGQTTGCRNAMMLGYFGERPPPGCGDRCDNCNRPLRAAS